MKDHALPLNQWSQRRLGTLVACVFLFTNVALGQTIRMGAGQVIQDVNGSNLTGGWAQLFVGPDPSALFAVTKGGAPVIVPVTDGQFTMTGPFDPILGVFPGSMYLQIQAWKQDVAGATYYGSSVPYIISNPSPPSPPPLPSPIEISTFSLFNSPPSITSIADQTISVNSSTGPLAFNVGDAETPLAALVVTAFSSNEALVPTASIVLAGSGANKTVTVTPVANQVGTTTITLTVWDSAAFFSSTSFLVSVKATPAIGGVVSQTITYGTASVNLSGTVSALGTIFPTDGETVTITINGVVQSATVAGGAGGFSISYLTATIPASGSPYPVTYTYSGNSYLYAAPDNTGTTLTVNKAPLSVTANNAARPYGSPNPGFTASYTGFVNGEDASVLSGSPTFFTPATIDSPVGPYPITPSLGTLSADSYNFIAFVDGILTVTPSPDPFVVALTPADGATGVSANTSISAVVEDGTVTSVFSIGLQLDGMPVTASSSEAGNQTIVTYTPGSPLTGGLHTAQVSWTDSASGHGDRLWIFRVAYTATSAAADGEEGSLRDLIITANASPGPDIIVLPAGTYALTVAGAGEDACATGDLDVLDDLTVVGAGATQTIIDAAGLGDRVFQLVGSTHRLVMSGLRIASGNPPVGTDGGGVLSEGDLTLEQCEVILCSASGASGGGVAAAGTLILDRTTLQGNTAQRSGAIHFSGVSMSIADCVIANNSATTDAGAMSIRFGDATIVRSRFTGNWTLSGCGGIYIDIPPNVVMDSCEISGNSTMDVSAGGMFSAGTVHLLNCTFSENSVTSTPAGSDAAGAIVNDSHGSMNAVNCTVAWNESSGNSGGILARGTLTARNCLVALNLVPGVGEIDLVGSSSFVSGGHNLFQVSPSPAPAWAAGDLYGMGAGITMLADHGGPTLTHALTASSPAIDAGDNAGAPATDQRGLPRIVNGTVDIGAFEYSGVNTAPTIAALGAPLAGAIEEIVFPIPHNVLLAATHAADAEGDPIQFVVTSIADDGLLFKDEAVAGVGTTLSPGEELVWVCYPHLVPTTPISAFEIEASDGLLSSGAVPVPIAVVAPLCALNNLWPSACDLAPQSAAGDPVTIYQANQALNELDECRWYRFPVSPGDRIIVILSDLPDNYDAFLFKDVLQAYLELADPNYSATLSKLANLSVEAAPTAFSPTAFSPTAFSPTAFSPTAFSPTAFSPTAFSPTAFSPTAFSPTAFSPTAFSPTAFSPTAFSPTAFSPTAFSPTAFSPTAFSPTAFSPTAFSPTAFSPTAFSPTAFSPTAFSGAPIRSLLALSAFPGTAPEGIYLNAWDNSGNFYVCVRGRNGVFRIGAPFTLQIYVENGACAGIPAAPPVPAISAAPDPPNVETHVLFLMDSWGMANPKHDDAQANALPQEVQDLKTQLLQFAARPDIRGAVIDLGELAWMRDLQRWADSSPAGVPPVVNCPYAKNVVAGAIRQLVLAYRSVRPSIESIVLVGNDNVIPFFRYADQAGLANENLYYPPVLDNSSSQAALRYGTVLSQEAYGSTCGLSIHGSTFPVADIPVGRLVETPDDIIRILNSYPANGLLPAPNSALVVGYDFLADIAGQIRDHLTEAIGPNSVDALIAARDLRPELGWTATDLLNALTQRRHDLIFLAGHFDGGCSLAADWKTCLTAAEVAACKDVDLRNAIVFGAGCHVGFNIVDEFGVAGYTPEPDWAQSFALKQAAAFVGGTGYQYGDTDFIEYNERLYLEFARQLCSGLRVNNVAEPISIGQALLNAKRRYLEGTPLPREIHEKTVLEVALYGLPMIRVLPPIPSSPPGGYPPILTGNPTLTTAPGSVRGLLVRDEVFATPVGTLTEEQREAVIFPLTDQNNPDTLFLSYFLGEDDQVLSTPCEPVLPLFVRDATRTDVLLRGVGFRGGNYQDTGGVRPMTGAPATDIRGVHAVFRSDFFYPIQPWSVNYYGQACGGNEQTLLYLFPVQHCSETGGSELSIRRVFSSLNLRLYFSGNTQSYQTRDADGQLIFDLAGRPVMNVLGASAPPAISEVADTVDQDGVHFHVQIGGDPATGIQEVWVTYTTTDNPGQWRSIDLAPHEEDDNLPEPVLDYRLWEATRSLAELQTTDAGNIRYLVQAASGMGLVTMDSRLGAFYIPGQSPEQESSLSVQASPGAGDYGAEVALTATLTVPQGANAPNRIVQFGIGGQRWQALTDSSGVATVPSARLLGLPGTYVLQAAYLAEPGYAGASDWKPFLIGKQTPTLTLQAYSAAAGSPSTVMAILCANAEGPLSEKKVYFEVKNAAGTTVASAIQVTDAQGQALLEAIPVPPGQYQVTAQFGGAFPPGLNFDDPCYCSCSSSGSFVLDFGAQIPATIQYTGDSSVAAEADVHLSARVNTVPAVDRSLATILYTIADAAGTVAETLAPVMVDGRSYAMICGLASGNYTLTLTLLGGGFVADPVTAMVAVYDPKAGFVTGGGWINSPAGAYTPDPNLKGKATFSFVSKYQKGAQTPTGETQFHFQARNLKFSSTSYDWLVVAGARAQYKGSGTINGAGNYGFLLTAVDGQVAGGGGADRFRIKITNSSGEVVYDNNRDAADSANPTTGLGGGSITIHK